jgi:hypothetical protein
MGINSVNQNLRQAFWLLAGIVFVYFLFVILDIQTGYRTPGGAIFCNVFIVLGYALWYIIFEMQDKK